jgi:hypothetical protein
MEEDIQIKWMSYFEEQLNGENERESLGNVDHEERRVYEITTKITTKENKAAMKQMKHKPPVPSGIKAKMLKAVDSVSAD